MIGDIIGDDFIKVKKDLVKNYGFETALVISILKCRGDKGYVGSIVEISKLSEVVPVPKVRRIISELRANGMLDVENASGYNNRFRFYDTPKKRHMVVPQKVRSIIEELNKIKKKD